MRPFSSWRLRRAGGRRRAGGSSRASSVQRTYSKQQLAPPPVLPPLISVLTESEHNGHILHSLPLGCSTALGPMLNAQLSSRRRESHLHGCCARQPDRSSVSAGGQAPSPPLGLRTCACRKSITCKSKCMVHALKARCCACGTCDAHVTACKPPLRDWLPPHAAG